MGIRSLFSGAAVAALAVTGCQGIRIIQSNDDGWAELYLRSFHDSLLSGGHDAVVSAPAENQSGRSKSLPGGEPLTVTTQKRAQLFLVQALVPEQ